MKIPCASDVEITVCCGPECRCVHFVLLDESDKPFAQAALRVDHIPSIIESLRNCAYQIAATKEPGA